jgi:hypothetical protein
MGREVENQSLNIYQAILSAWSRQIATAFAPGEGRLERTGLTSCRRQRYSKAAQLPALSRQINLCGDRHGTPCNLETVGKYMSGQEPESSMPTKSSQAKICTTKAQSRCPFYRAWRKSPPRRDEGVSPGCEPMERNPLHCVPNQCSSRSYSLNGFSRARPFGSREEFEERLSECVGSF